MVEITCSVINGDCREILKQYPDNKFDSIVTDPPYGLSFMGKEWDRGIPGVPFWQEFLRVSKPGAHILAFGGTRTHHRLMVAIEDAGWEIRDCLMWVYGSGFPKSLDISKAIDKAAGVEREVVGIAFGMGKQNPEWNGTAQGRKENSFKPEYELTAPATDSAKQWSGWGTALKPAWEPIILARKPLDGTVAQNVIKWGVGGINVDGCRVAINPEVDDPRLGGNGDWSSDKMAKNVYEGGYAGVRVGSSALGRFPANLIHDGSQTVLELFPQSNGGAFPAKSNVPTGKGYDGGWGCVNNGKRTEMGSGSAARFFYCAKASKSERNIGCENLPIKTAGECTDRQEGTAGLNSPRAGAGRTNGSRNHHPTVKPLALLQYLCRLITPPNGTILDPFAGSGTTGIAATAERFNSVLIELDADNYEICKRASAGERAATAGSFWESGWV
jgi:DNA modification methylase